MQFTKDETLAFSKLRFKKFKSPEDESTRKAGFLECLEKFEKNKKIKVADKSFVLKALEQVVRNCKAPTPPPVQSVTIETAALLGDIKDTRLLVKPLTTRQQQKKTDREMERRQQEAHASVLNVETDVEVVELVQNKTNVHLPTFRRKRSAPLSEVAPPKKKSKAATKLPLTVEQKKLRAGRRLLNKEIFSWESNGGTALDRCERGRKDDWHLFYKSDLEHRKRYKRKNGRPIYDKPFCKTDYY